jgi:hypothetical protein
MFSSPGIPKTYLTPSFSRHLTTSFATVVASSLGVTSSATLSSMPAALSNRLDHKKTPLHIWIQMNFYPNPDGPTNHIDYNIGIATYNMNLIIAVFQVIFEMCTDNLKGHGTEIPS